MSPAGEAHRLAPALVGDKVNKAFRREKGGVTEALRDVSLVVQHGRLTALVGPDGAGKTTLLRIAAGLLKADSGTLRVLGIEIGREPHQVQSRIGYMPQRFGLYEDLTVEENLDLYADLHGVAASLRQSRYPGLMEMTGLGPFTARLAGRLSGGMKQKLGLACTLVRSPELLILDEPTVGVDPLSRRELWSIIHRLVDAEGLTVLLSTAYLDEAERCGHVIVLHEGNVLAEGAPNAVADLAAGNVVLASPPAGQTPRAIQASLLDNADAVDAVPEGGKVRIVRAAASVTFAGISTTPTAPRFEDGFMVLLRRRAPPASSIATQPAPQPLNRAGEIVVEVEGLVRRFGTFTAVDHVSFAVRRGEIFGLLGPNGAGKTTTFRMLCGLLPATHGTLRIAGIDLSRARAAARQRFGYVAQKFALYGDLSVAENLEFFASAYGLYGRKRRDRIAWALAQFDLAAHVHEQSGELPGGYKRRLAMAAALLHEPETLFLDEPTSGADPFARRDFWRRITMLSEEGVTIVVTTHFMEEAEYCDHVVILDQGRVLAKGTPAGVRGDASALGAGPAPGMEDAFIAIVEAARHGEAMRGLAA